MCSPQAVLTTFSVGTQLYSMYAGNKAAEDEGEFNYGVSMFNARVLENEAKRTLSAGNEAEIDQRQQTAQMTSTQRAQLGAAGVDVNSGTASQIQQDTVNVGEVDALRIRSNYAQRADTLNTQAELTRLQGKAAKMGVQNTVLTNTIGTIGNIALNPRFYTSDSSAITG